MSWFQFKGYALDGQNFNRMYFIKMKKSVLHGIFNCPMRVKEEYACYYKSGRILRRILDILYCAWHRDKLFWQNNSECNCFTDSLNEQVKILIEEQVFRQEDKAILGSSIYPPYSISNSCSKSSWLSIICSKS